MDELNDAEWFADKIVYDYAFRLVGLPYIWGGSNPGYGLDCSGLVIELLKSCAVLHNKFDTTAQGLHTRFSDANFGVNNIEPMFGTLAFYGESTFSIKHVAFCLDGFRMIEAGGGSRECTTPEIARAKNACVRIRPIMSRNDLVAFATPDVFFKNLSKSEVQ